MHTYNLVKKKIGIASASYLRHDHSNKITLFILWSAILKRAKACLSPSDIPISQKTKSICVSVRFTLFDYAYICLIQDTFEWKMFLSAHVFKCLKKNGEKYNNIFV